MHDILQAFTLTLPAGLSTGIGSCIAFVARHTNKRFLSVSLGFSVGVMIYVSFIEIFSQAQQALGLPAWADRRKLGHRGGLFRRHAGHCRDRQVDSLAGEPA